MSSRLVQVTVVPTFTVSCGRLENEVVDRARLVSSSARAVPTAQQHGRGDGEAERKSAAIDRDSLIFVL